MSFLLVAALPCLAVARFEWRTDVHPPMMGLASSPVNCTTDLASKAWVVENTWTEDEAGHLLVMADKVPTLKASDACGGHRCDKEACPCGCECGTASDPGLCYVPAAAHGG
mmetsp:Transcript_46394/g.86677  ORF Transcript_46394/g.86677 Transcript_46394/m.86677 type:complete len:111 (+) Transcript_46394:59-391(+)